MTILSYQTIFERVTATVMRKSVEAFGGPQTIAERRPEWQEVYGMEIEPWEPGQKVSHGATYGLGPAGYDIRIGKIDRTIGNLDEAGNTVRTPVETWPVKTGDFVLLSSMERLRIPHDVIAFVCDKSSLARKGLALQNTVLEPGWEGFITLELSNHGPHTVRIAVGQPIAQVVFHLLDKPTERPYRGRYQNQPDRPVKAIDAGDTNTPTPWDLQTR